MASRLDWTMRGEGDESGQRKPRGAESEWPKWGRVI